MDDESSRLFALMDASLQKRFEQTERLYLKLMQPYVPDYEVTIKIVDWAERRRNNKAISKLIEETSPSFGLHITHESKTLEKRVEFSVSDGTNFQGMYYLSPSIGIKKPKQGTERNFIYLQQYFRHFKIDREIDDFFDASDPEFATDKMNQYLEHIAFFMQRDDIKQILTSDHWVVVPLDWTGYK